MVSTTIRTADSGGEIHSFWAMNSFSMSFCMVPPSLSQGTPCLSASARYMARATDAVQLMVIEVVTRSSGMSRNRISKSASVEIGHALAADLAARPRVIGVVAHQRRACRRRWRARSAPARGGT